MRVWALVSRESTETIELFLDPRAAKAALEDVLRDEPTFFRIVRVVELDWEAERPAVLEGASLN